MVKRLENNINLVDIVAGTGVFYALDKTDFGSLVSVELNQQTVSALGVTVKLVQSNGGITWVDVLEDEDDPATTVEVTTTTTSEGLFLASDFIEFGIYGIFVDRPAGVTGQLQVEYNSKSSL